MTTTKRRRSAPARSQAESLNAWGYLERREMDAGSPISLAAWRMPQTALAKALLLGGRLTTSTPGKLALMRTPPEVPTVEIVHRYTGRQGAPAAPVSAFSRRMRSSLDRQALKLLA